jgi:flagellar biogenesis protein FliO
MIEVMANHYLGPKKSISVVKVQGRLMVLGVTNESINLIAQLPDGASQDAIAEAAIAQFDLETEAQLSVQPSSGASSSGAKFSDALAQSQSKPRLKTRDMIRNKLEGMKPLA